MQALHSEGKGIKYGLTDCTREKGWSKKLDDWAASKRIRATQAPNFAEGSFTLTVFT